MTHHASGTFDVTLTPQQHEEGVGDPAVGRLAVVKKYHGDLEGSAQGQMLGVRTGVKDSAGYVAIEVVTGLLARRSGSFALQHAGIMTRGTPALSVTVVPDSGTGELAGISGTMTISIIDGKHFYEFDYAIASEATLV